MSGRSAAAAGSLVYGAEPRARLMPPEVAARRKDASRRRGLVALVMLTLVVVAGGIAAAFWFAAMATAQLDAARQETTRLLEEQLSYAEVLQVQSAIDSIAAQRGSLAEVEILWSEALEPYLAEISPILSLDSLSMTGNEPGQEPLTTVGPLREPLVATLTLSVTTEGLPNADGWLRRLELIPTLADASVDSITTAGDGLYSTTITINLNAEALSGRFAPEGADQ